MLDIRVNRDAMARVGVTAQDVQDTITATLGGRESGMIFEGDRRFPVVIRPSDAERADLGLLEQVQVPAAAAVAMCRCPASPISASSTGRTRSAARTASAASSSRRTCADATSAAWSRMRRRRSPARLPAGSYLEWGGQFENPRIRQQRLKLVVPACFVLILLLLYGALGSVRDAAIVFTGVPRAGGGVLRCSFAAWTSRSRPRWDSSHCRVSRSSTASSWLVRQELIRSGMDRAEAARTGALQRLRPVVMTALVASLGFVPMAFASGAGAEVQSRSRPSSSAA
jgi:cobalt-zinc-cadmium resistance protein CzcA